MFSSRNILKYAMAAALLLCLLRMPYWYFQLVRIFGMLGFAWLAYAEYKENIRFTPFLFGACAVIMNPFIKIAFGRSGWNKVDVIMAALLAVSIFLERKLKQTGNGPSAG